MAKHDNSVRRRRWRKFIAWWVPDLHSSQGKHDASDLRQLKLVVWYLAAAGVVVTIVGWRVVDSIGFALFIGSFCVALIGVVALIYRFRRIVEVAVQLMLLMLFVGGAAWGVLFFFFSSDPEPTRWRWVVVLTPVVAATAAASAIVKFIDRFSLTDWLVLFAIYMLYHVGRAVDRLSQRIDDVAEKLEPSSVYDDIEPR